MTPSQLAKLKAAINANPEWAAFPNNTDGHIDLAAELNKPSSPAVKVWRTDAPVSAILDSITWANYTPNDVVTDSDLGDILSRKTARLLTIQTKQINLDIMLGGRNTFNAAPVNARAGLRDAVVAVPSGAGGANTSPGGASGANVLNACTRDANKVEVALAFASQASDTTGSVTARVMDFEGSVSPQQVQAARELP